MKRRDHCDERSVHGAVGADRALRSNDDFWRDYDRYSSRGVVFVRPPSLESYGTVAVFKDLYGNLGDLVQYDDPVA
jgi:hypothetical protein